MNTLTGCRREPLGSYLQALGAWRAAARVLGGDTRAAWSAGCLVLDSPHKDDAFVRALLERFEPLPLVSPWNAGSGFARNGKSKTAELLLDQVRSSMEPRLAALREAVAAADRVVDDGLKRGWGGKGDELWDKTHKTDVLLLCRNTLPDEALRWLDAVVALGQAANGDLSVTYSRLLGTGGNFGRQDLQTTYLQRAFAVLGGPAKQSSAWLRAALFSDESIPYLRDAVGQFDPGRAGGIQSSPREKADDQGFVNPWSFLLTIEGALLFASTATRRQGALNTDAALPFMVRGSNIGFSSDAAAEKVLGEIWTPEWERFASLSEVQRLLQEGRADWHRRPAVTGLDFVRAVTSLGVDRGISRFTRHVFTERHGQNPLAVPVGVVEVTRRSEVSVLAELDGWLRRLRGGEPPATVASGVRRVDEAMYAVANGGGPAALRRVLGEVGLLHEAVSRSGRTRERVRPLRLDAAAWWRTLMTDTDRRPDDPEWWAAAALAAGQDHPSYHFTTRPAPGRADSDQPPGATLRELLTPVRLGGRSEEWTNGPPAVESGIDVIRALAAAHRRRSLPGAVPDPLRRPQSLGDAPGSPADGASSIGDGRPGDLPMPAVRGAFTAFRYGLEVTGATVTALLTGAGFDDDQLRTDLMGLLLLGWHVPREQLDPGRAGNSAQRRSGSHQRPHVVAPPLLTLMLPFFSSVPLPVRLREDDATDTPIVLRPGATWLPSLHAGDTFGVARDAIDRLRIAGVRCPLEGAHMRGRVDPDRLAAALLLRVNQGVRHSALTRVGRLPSIPRDTTSSTTATQGVHA